MRNNRGFNWQNGLIGICSCLILLSCSKSDPVVPDSNRTVLVYMAADNNLNGYGSSNIDLMLKGMKNVPGRLVIYCDPAGDVPHLMTIKGGKQVRIDTVRTYAEENSASAEVLSRVIQETRELYPSESYGLILWSHGFGWLPQNYYFPGARSFLSGTRRTTLMTKYFGEDDRPGDNSGVGYIEVPDLARALSDGFDFILFDACFMGSVETLYELRGCADYFIVSPAEVIANGFPYDQIVPLLWGGEEDLKQLCTSYFNFYNTHDDPKNEGWQSATVALVKAAELETLALAARNVLKGRTDFSGLNVWRYPLSYSFLPDVFYDLGDYINVVGTPEQKVAFQKQLNRTVLYKLATSRFFDGTIPTDKYSGLSTYIPLSQWSMMNEKYDQLAWPQVVYDK